MNGISMIPVSVSISPRLHRKTHSSYRYLRLVFLASIALPFAACTMVGPDFKKPTAPVAPSYLGVPGKPMPPSSGRELLDWWTVFNDPTLNQLIELAYKQNLTLLSAGTRVIAARAQLGVAIGYVFPQQQTLDGALNYNRASRADVFSTIEPSHDFWRASLGPQVAWELDFWGKFRRGVESADAAYLASIATYDDVLVTLLGDIATTYIGIRTVERQIELAKSNIVRQRKALRIAQVRFNEGSTTRLDVYQAQNVLGATEAQVPQLQVQLQEGVDLLHVLLGVPPQPLDGLLDRSIGIPQAPNNVELGMPADLLRRRPDIRAAEFAAAAQSAQIGVAKADLYPAFSLLGSVGLVSSNVSPANLGDFFTHKALTFSFGPSFQWNILNYGQITNNVRVQDANFQSLLIDYKNTVIKAQQEVEDGVAAFILAREEASALARSVKAAQGALGIAFDQYNEGLVDFTTVLTAEQNLLTAENDLAIARGSIATSLARTYRALGGGWEIVRNGNSFITPETREEMVNRTDWGDVLPPTGVQPQPKLEPTSGFWQWLGIRPPEF
jgi:NodT family efflux transporter outer membrane factor (OMF) lipoprotein